MTRKLTAFVTLLLNFSIILSLALPMARANETRPLNGYYLKPTVNNTVTQGDKPAASLSDILNPDGTVRTDKSGSFDARGLQMELAPNGSPRFASVSVPNQQHSPAETGASNSVYAFAVDGSGNIYVGGSFSSINGISANRVAKWNGSVWSSLGSGTGSTGNGVSLGGSGGFVNDLAVQGNNLYVGGAFSKAYNNASSNIDANNVVMWNGLTWVPLGNGTGTNGNGVDSNVEALVVSNSKLYVGGSFERAYNNIGSSILINHIATWDGLVWRGLGNGSNPSNNLNNGVDHVVDELAASGGNIYVGGFFSRAFNNTTIVNVNHIAVWNDGTGWAGMGTGLNGTVYAILPLNGNIYAGGNFQTTGANLTVNYLAFWNGNSWSPVGNGVNSFVFALSRAGNNIYAGGFFNMAHNSTSSSIEANHVAVWNGTNWATLGSGTGTNGNGVNSTVRALLALPDNKVYAGGDFGTAYNNNGNELFASHLALWNGNVWSVPGIAPIMVSIDDTSVIETNDSGVRADFIVRLVTASDQAVTVRYSTANGTALAGSDYQQVTNESVSFFRGETSKTISVFVNPDTLNEGNEHFFVNLSATSGGTISDSQAVGTIVDDDSGPVSFEFGPNLSTVSEGAGAATFTVLRRGDTSGTVSVDHGTNTDSSFIPCNTAGNTASSRCDFAVTIGTLDFGPGEVRKTFAVPLIDDYLTETNETLSLTLSSPRNGVLGPASTTSVAITDNDPMTGANKVFVTRAQGADAVPATGAFGTASANLTLNDAETQLNLNLTASGVGGIFGGSPTFHIHGPASVMGTGPVLYTLPSSIIISNHSIALSPEQVGYLKAGLLYLDVHTTNLTNPEIRGQIASQPLENAKFFVRQHYHDFLSRQPDTAGLDYWVGQIANVCGTDTACIRQRRIEVSAAFFVELEFQQTGSYVYRLYRAAYGNNQPAPNPENHPDAVKIPGYQVFLEDRARVVGGANLAQSQLALANTFVQRTEFIARYPASMTAAQYVDALLSTVQSASGADLSAQRDALISLYNSNGRGAVLYRLADDNTTGNPINNRAFITAEYNRAFVLTEYFGYLRRNPDMNGFNFWLNAINNNAGFNLQTAAGQNAMVCSFLTSQEYQERFSNAAPRTTGECPTP